MSIAFTTEEVLKMASEARAVYLDPRGRVFPAWLDSHDCRGEWNDFVAALNKAIEEKSK